MQARAVAQMRGSALAAVIGWLAMSARLSCALAGAHMYVHMCLANVLCMWWVALLWTCHDNNKGQGPAGVQPSRSMDFLELFAGVATGVAQP